MANIKQEEMKKLLISADFKEETYDALSMQERIILKNSAHLMKEKNSSVPQADTFFKKREEFFNFLVLRRLQKMETMYALFTRSTNLPYVYCDPETCSDQIWIFSEEHFAKKTALQELQKKRELLVVKLENKQFLSFYLSLYPMGVNELLIDRGANALAVQLETLVKKPDYSAQPPEKQPVLNPSLTLTAIYFAQENSLPQEEKNAEELKDLEEELLVNLTRSRLLLPVQVPEGSGEQVQTKDLRLPLLKLPNGNSYHPVCSDPGEFQKFNKEQKLRVITVDNEKLRAILSKEARGILLNPASVRLTIPREKLD